MVGAAIGAAIRRRQASPLMALLGLRKSLIEVSALQKARRKSSPCGALYFASVSSRNPCVHPAEQSWTLARRDDEGVSVLRYAEEEQRSQGTGGPPRCA
jgi:hypothetical protein